MKILDKETGEYKELRIKPGGDTLPIGTIVEYDGKMVDIFDKNNINNLYGYIYGTNNIYVSSTTGADKMLYVPIESSKTYVVSKVSSTKFRIATNPTVPTVGESTVTSRVANDKATELSITSGSTDKYLILYYYNSSNDTLTEQEILNSIKIKKQDYTIPEGYEEVEEIENLSDLITNKNANINTSTSKIFLYKYGKVIQLYATITRSGNWSTEDVLFKIPVEYLPKVNEGTSSNLISPILISGWNIGAIIINCSSGTVMLSNVSGNNNWLCINTTYICR